MRKWILMLLGSAVIFISCKQKIKQNKSGITSPNPITFIEEKDTLELGKDGTYEIKKNQVISFRAYENPSTGNIWTLVKPSGNNTIKQIDDHFKSANNDPEIVGAGGERRLIFQAVQAGEDSIVLWNGRSLDDILEYSRFKIIVH
jgi:predicted secreted protein